MTKEEKSLYMKEWRKNNKEKIKQYNLKYNAVSKEEKTEYMKEWRKNNKEKIKQYNLKYNAVFRHRKEKVIQSHTELKIVAKNHLSVEKNVDPDYLTYHILISKGKNKITKELADIFIIMINKMLKKFTYSTEELKQDVKQHAILMCCLQYKNFNEEKYDNAFPYLSEIIKRGLTQGYNLYNSSKYISLSKFENYY